MAHWAILLAGGEGTRMRSYIQKAYGFSLPKQYCRFGDARSLLERTSDRALELVDSHRMITIIGQGHRAHLMGSDLNGRVIQQPDTRDTAAAVLLGLTLVLAEDESGTVAIFPTDHFIHPEGRFLDRMRRCFQLAQSLQESPVLMAAVPDRPETDYGWIKPGMPVKGCASDADSACRVASFYEKPSPVLARKWFAQGYLWNTMITVSQANTLWTLAKEFLPEMRRAFERLLNLWQMSRYKMVTFKQAEAALQEVYQALPRANFSRDFLQVAADRCVAFPLDGIFWSDWGRPERVKETRRIMSQNKKRIAALRPLIAR